MGENSKIEWCDHTFNPVIGCQKVSEGCKFCYAETLMDHRYGKAKWGPGQTRVRTSAANWREPYRWNRQAESEGRRQRIFCASLSDVFEDHPDWIEPRVDLFRMIVHTPALDWLLLTKRPQNVMPMLDRMGWPSLMDNIWIGTSVENQAAADERIPILLEVPAKVRFLSMEPLLGPVNLRKCYEKKVTRWDGGVNWVIVGGESGHGARPMHPDWARSLRDQCQGANVPFLFKQWGEWVGVGQVTEMQTRGGEDLYHWGHAVYSARVGKKVAGRLLDGVEWNQLPG